MASDNAKAGEQFKARSKAIYRINMVGQRTLICMGILFLFALASWLGGFQ